MLRRSCEGMRVMVGGCELRLLYFLSGNAFIAAVDHVFPFTRVMFVRAHPSTGGARDCGVVPCIWSMFLMVRYVAFESLRGAIVACTWLSLLMMVALGLGLRQWFATYSFHSRWSIQLLRSRWVCPRKGASALEHLRRSFGGVSGVGRQVVMLLSGSTLFDFGWYVHVEK